MVIIWQWFTSLQYNLKTNMKKLLELYIENCKAVLFEMQFGRSNHDAQGSTHKSCRIPYKLECKPCDNGPSAIFPQYSSNILTLSDTVEEAFQKEVILNSSQR